MVGAWSGANNFGDVRTLRATMVERAQQSGAILTYAKGTEISGTSDSGFAAAVAAAQNSDVAILALGESSDMSGEAASRAYLDLPGNQQQLLEAVVATGKPVVLLVFSGRPLVLDWAAQHVPAIMEVWFPGVETGPAIVDTLFGDVAPSGKLTMSFPRAVGQEPLYYNQLPTGRPIQHADPAHPGYVEMKYVSRYLDVPNDALFPFGHGLTYSTFGYSGVSLSTQSISCGLADARPEEPARGRNRHGYQYRQAPRHRDRGVLCRYPRRQHRAAGTQSQGLCARHARPGPIPDGSLSPWLRGTFLLQRQGSAGGRAG